MQAIAIESFQSLSVRLIGLGLLHGLWISLGVASVVALGFQLRPYLSHQARHRVLVIALLLVTAAPIVVTRLQIAFSSRRAGNEVTSAEITVLPSTGELDESRPRGGKEAIASVMTHSSPSSRIRSILSAALSESIRTIHRLQPFLLVVWAAGVLACTCVFAVGTVAVHRMCREGLPAPERIRQRAKQMARLAGLKTPPRVIVHPRAREPFLCGILAPVILLPEAWLGRCHRDLLDAILAHELAHARRRDLLVNLGQRFVEIGLFFSPAVHWLSRSLRRQREFCADSLAVRLTHDPLALAGALEWVARVRRSFPARPAIGAPLGGQNFSLLPRIQELLGMMPSRSRPRFWPFAVLPAAGIMAVVTTASGLSQDQPDAVTPGVPVEKRRTGGTQEFPTKIRSQHASGHDSRPIAPAHSETDIQISYKIRYFDLNAEVWRELLKDRQGLVKHEANASAWIVDEKALTDVLEHLEKYGARRIYESSNLTAFEHKTIMIKTSAGSRWMPNDVISSVLKVTGTRQPGGTQLTVDLRALPLDEIAAPLIKEPPIDATIDAEILTLTIHNRFRRVSCRISDSFSLAISLGLDEQQDQANDATGQVRNEGPLRAKERLFLITPRKLMLKTDEEPIGVSPKKPVVDTPAR